MSTLCLSPLGSFTTELHEIFSIKLFLAYSSFLCQMCNYHSDTIIFNKTAGDKRMIYFIMGYDETLPYFHVTHHAWNSVNDLILYLFIRLLTGNCHH